MIEKIFKAYDVRATYPSPLNEEDAWKVGHATAQFLKRSRANKVAANVRVARENTMIVGRDMRPSSSPELGRRPSSTASARSAWTSSTSAWSTPRSPISPSTRSTAVGGIQVTTASHNPIQYNGFKISGPKAKPIGSGYRAWTTSSASPCRPARRARPASKASSRRHMDLWPAYKKLVLSAS